MMGIERELRVKAGAEEYPIYLGTDLLVNAGKLLQAVGLKEKALVVTNPKVAGLYLDLLLEGLARADFRPQVVMIPDGEEYKQLAVGTGIRCGGGRRLERDSPSLRLVAV